MTDQWEYCCLLQATNHLDGVAHTVDTVVAYYGPTPFNESIAPEKWGRAIGKLGQDGWEMVSSSATHAMDDTGHGGTITLYFKRRFAGQPTQPLLGNL